MAQSVRKKLHVPLPPELHAELKERSERRGQPATVLAREAIAAWLQRERQDDLAREIRAYAETVAGSEEDLDEDLEDAAAEALSEAPA